MGRPSATVRRDPVVTTRFEALEAISSNAVPAVQFIAGLDADLINSLPLIVWTADARTFQFQYVSKGAELLLGYPVERWIDEPTFWCDHLHSDDRDNALALCHSETQICRDHELLYRMVAADGRLVWLRDKVQVRSEQGLAVELSGFMFDVTSEIEAQRALKESEENYRRMVHFSPDAIGVHRDGRYIYVNPSFMRLLGTEDPNELIGREVLSLVHPDYAGVLRRLVASLGEGEQPKPLHERLIRIDGSPIDVEVTSLPITFSGTPAIQVVFRDISERVRADERIRLISLGTHEAIFEGNLSTGDFWANQAYRTMIGAADRFASARDQHIARVHPGDRTAVESRMRHRLETGTARWTDEYRMELASGSPARVLERGRIFHDAEGKPTRVLVALLDVTDLRDAEEGLEAAREECELIGLEAVRERIHSDQRYRQIVEGVSDVIFTLDSNGRITSLNHAFERSTGATIDEWIGRSFAELLLPESTDRAERDFELVLHGAPGIVRVYKMRGASGDVLEIETSGQQRVPGDPTQGTIGMARDVTERNGLARRVEESKRLESLGDLAATMAHEMNNVLMAIQPYCELLILKAGDDELAAMARRRINTTIERGKRITSEILYYANPKEPAAALIEPVPWMAEVTALIDPLLPANVTLTVDTRLLAPIVGDQHYLEQVLTNLVLNAVHAMPNGGSLTIELTEDSGSGRTEAGLPAAKRFACLTLRDTGPGIPAHVLSQIFEPLFTTKRGGTGLGLAIAKRLIERQGGAITVESSETTGTAFHLYLPMIDGF
jgi:PAS domain S-box-containing protein